jgi:hypothetical protein
MVDGDIGGQAFPIGQDVHGEIIDRRGKLRVIEPDVPHFGG